MNRQVEKYFDAVPEDRRPLVEKLHDLILELYPDATVGLDYKMPTYKVNEGWVALANQKRYVSLYTCGEIHLAQFKKKHPDIPTGKGCINFKPNVKIPLASVRQVVRHAIDHPKGK